MLVLAAICLHLDMIRYFYTAWCRLRKGYHQSTIRQGTWQVVDKDDEEYWAKQTSLRHSGGYRGPTEGESIYNYFLLTVLQIVLEPIM